MLYYNNLTFIIIQCFSSKVNSFLNNTQKTLNVINQAIPVYYQIKPMWSNMKSFSRILTAFNSSDNNESTNNNHSNNSSNKNNFSNNQQENYQRSLKKENTNLEKKETSSNSPTFFIS